MGAPLVLSGGFFSTTAYPGHAVSGADVLTGLETPGHEGYRVGTGRRSYYTNTWTPQTPNVAQGPIVGCDRVRAADCLFLDRGPRVNGVPSNYLSGYPVALQISNDYCPPVLVGGQWVQPRWAANATYTLGQQVTDSNGNTQEVTTAGTSGAAQPGGWSAAIGGTTGDGGVTWTLVNIPLWQTLWTITIPAAPGPNALGDVSYGVLTEEGAFGVLFPVAAALFWRLLVPAMGVGLTPTIVGACLDLAYQPAYGGFLTPWSEDRTQLTVKEVLTEWGWAGGGPRVPRRAVAMNTRLLTDDEYDLARITVEGNYGAGRPMWIVFDQGQADRAFLARRPSGLLGYGFEGARFPRQAQIPLFEHEPLRP